MVTGNDVAVVVFITFSFRLVWLFRFPSSGEAGILAGSAIGEASMEPTETTLEKRVADLEETLKLIITHLQMHDGQLVGLQAQHEKFSVEYQRLPSAGNKHNWTGRF